MNLLVARRSRGALLIGLVALFGLTACGGGESPAPDPSTQARLPMPVGAKDPALRPSAAAAAIGGCDPRASLRPEGALPAAGAMPAGSTMETILRRGHLIVASDQNNYLFGFRDAGSYRLVGFDVEIAREVARAVFGDPDRVQYVSVPSAERLNAVAQGRADLAAASITITCQRRQQVEFSSDYFTGAQKVLVRKGSGITKMDDLGGKKVCAVVDTTSIRTVFDHPAKPVAVSATSWTDCLVLLQQGQVEAISTDDNILVGLAAQDPYVEVVGPALSDEPHGLATPLDKPDFTRFVNQVLDRMRADGTWTAIYRRWMGVYEPVLQQKSTPPPARYR
jgi:polar amino acid transport system substrate-binding protein